MLAFVPQRGTDVNLGFDDHALDHLIAGNGDGAVADDEDFERDTFERMALGDAIHLLLHRAGVGVDVEGDQVTLAT